MTLNDDILILLGNGNRKLINSTISTWTRAQSVLLSSKLNSLLLSNWDPWNNREKKWKDAKSIFKRCFHGRRRCRIVRSLTSSQHCLKKVKGMFWDVYYTPWQFRRSLIVVAMLCQCCVVRILYQCFVIVATSLFHFKHRRRSEALWLAYQKNVL